MINTHLTKLLLIEDELPIRRFLRASLPTQGYQVEEAITGEEGLWQAAIYRPDVIILDLGLPDIDGLEVTKQLRHWTTTPIIVLSARSREHDKIAALDAGADDYLTKPFDLGELLARLRVASRHRTPLPGAQSDPIFRVGQLRVDLARRLVWVQDEQVHLTPNEYKLLATLVQHAGKVLTHRQLLSEVWGAEHLEENHYLRVYMAQLRHKLEKEPARPRYLLTEPGVGYRLVIDEMDRFS
jgi:two-component system, OmpR family, KDP operon response regulator KdpE